jgi:hypothetical protein
MHPQAEAVPEGKPLSDQQIKRRLFRFFRFHKIEFEQQDGLFLLGSATCIITNGELHAHFPRIGKHYRQHVYFRIEFTDPWNLYIKFSRMHNQLMTAFPMARIKFVPELFD